MVEMFKLAHPKVVMLGDSLTALASWSDLTGCTSLSNRGLPGAKVWDLIACAAVVAARKPRKVFVLAGINDLPGANEQQIVDDLRKLVAALQPTDIVLTSILPVASGIGPPELPAKIVRINTQPSQFAGVHFLDLHSRMVGRDGYLIDTRSRSPYFVICA
jgi:hypothetical protein